MSPAVPTDDDERGHCPGVDGASRVANDQPSLARLLAHARVGRAVRRCGYAVFPAQ